MQSNAQAIARTVGVLFLFSMIAGGFGEFYVPSALIVAGDAAATARNLTVSESLFRLGFAAYLVEAVCDVGLSLIFYLLLRPIRHDLALLSAFFGLISTTLFAVAELFYFAAPVFLRHAKYVDAFSPEQNQTLAFLSLKLYGIGAAIFMVFYGLAMLIRGYLIIRSRFLPKFLGVVLAIAGAGFIIRNFVFVLKPAYASDLFLLPMFIAGLCLTAWMLTKGVDAEKWAVANAGEKSY